MRGCLEGIELHDDEQWRALQNPRMEAGAPREEDGEKRG